MVTAMAMAMAIVMITTIMMIDIHNHILPNVDDGSKDLMMTEKLLELYDLQNVNTLFLTPHVNSSVTRTNRQKHYEIFNKVKTISSKYNINLYLGAEIYISYKIPEINFDNYKMGNSNYILVEFSTINETPIREHVFNLKKRGFGVIIAHIERYNYLSYTELFDLKDMDILFQVNSSALIDKKNRFYKKAHKILKEGLVDFVATDCHNLTNRKPNMDKAFEKIVKLIGIDKARKLTYENQLKYLVK